MFFYSIYQGKLSLALQLIKYKIQKILKSELVFVLLQFIKYKLPLNTTF